VPLVACNHEIQALAPNRADLRSQKAFACGTRTGVLRTVRPTHQAFDRHLPNRSCRDRGLRIGAPDRPGRSSEIVAPSTPPSDAPSRSSAVFDACRLPGRHTRRSAETWPFTTTKKSLARTDRVWFRTNVLHACVPCLAWWSPRYVPSHRSRTDSDPELHKEFGGNPLLAQVRFAAAILRMSCCKSAGIGGRPGARDLHRQNNRNPCRCQRMSVSGLTTVSRRRQSRNRDSATSVTRVASSARCGFAWRSTYNANCFRRNTFSAAS
jgi:hypothetical protein